ncbi:hypothetical protein [Atopobacter phocae]|nr:hypothetical protein [Atopobacter phocae]
MQTDCLDVDDILLAKTTGKRKKKAIQPLSNLVNQLRKGGL